MKLKMDEDQFLSESLDNRVRPKDKENCPERLGLDTDAPSGRLAKWPGDFALIRRLTWDGTG